MRPKYVLWIGFGVVSGIWYLGDSAAHRVGIAPAKRPPVEVQRVAHATDATRRLQTVSQ